MTKETTIKFTRQDYLDNKCNHREYYGQFINNRIKNIVSRRLKVNEIKKALMDDKNLNTIKLAIWDSILRPLPAETANLLRELGDYPTLAGAVCIAKEAARQLVESES